jgi:hypothetical protein
MGRGFFVVVKNDPLDFLNEPEIPHRHSRLIPNLPAQDMKPYASEKSKFGE